MSSIDHANLPPSSYQSRWAFGFSRYPQSSSSGIIQDFLKSSSVSNQCLFQFLS
nr:MAG TPA: hypothetical protein [Caudoviricetes sp.]